MNKITQLVLAFLLLSSPAWATNYYVATTGNDTTGDGSVGNKWKTLAKACTSVSAGAHTINLAAGTYVETAVCNLAVGVSILGDSTGVDSLGLGQTTILQLGYNVTSFHGWIELDSTSEGVNGNQSISYVKIDGDLVVNGNNRYQLVHVAGRSNVDIHHVNIVDGYRMGVVFQGKASTNDTDGAPTTYATGNKFRNSTMTNSAKYYLGTGRGGINIGGQDGIEIYDNTITQVDRASGENGYPIKFYNAGHNKNLKIYSNTITKAPYDGSTFQFSIEMWNCSEGCEIYNNTIVGSVDICYGSNSPSGYGMKIYGNTIGTDTKQSQAESGIQLEDGGSEIFIYGNTFKNLNKGVRIQQQNSAPFTWDGVYIYNNVFNEVGYTGGTSDGLNGTAVSFTSNINTGVWNDINIVNNTIYTTYAEGYYGLSLGGVGDVTNLNVENNIITGFATAPIYSSMVTGGSTIDVLNITNNNFFANGNSDAYLTSGITPTNVTNVDNVIGDPAFDTPAFTLTSGSAAIAIGATDTFVTTDFTGASRGTTNDAGAYQYSVVLPSTGTRLGSGTFGGMKIQ